MSENIRNKSIGLTDEEAAAATGGVDLISPDKDFYFCPNCHVQVFYPKGGMKLNCNCGYNPYTGITNPPAGGAGMAMDML